MIEAFPMVSVGALPTFEALRDLKRRRFDSLINLSGSPFSLVYGEELARDFDLFEYEVPDLFSRESLSEDDWQAFSRRYLGQVLHAVGALSEQILSGRFVHCFCHQGISRSSLVAAGALVRCFAMPIEEAVQVVKGKNPRAQFYPRSYRVLKTIEFESYRRTGSV